MLCRREDPPAACAGRAALCAPGGGGAGAGPGAAAPGRGAGGLPHRRVGVLRPAPGHRPSGAHSPRRHRDSGGLRPALSPGESGQPGAGPLYRVRLCGLGGGQPGAGLPGDPGRSVRGSPAYLPPKYPPQRSLRPGGPPADERHAVPAQPPGYLRLPPLQPPLHPLRRHRRLRHLCEGLRAPQRPGRRGGRPGLLPRRQQSLAGGSAHRRNASFRGGHRPGG